MTCRTVHNRVRHGWSLIGMLITFACMAVLFSISMTALNKAVTGEGSAQMNTVRSTEDKINLYGIATGMITYAADHNEWFPVPTDAAGSTDVSLNTTASFYSLMIALEYVRPESLVSGNEYSGYVEVKADYDYTAYQPAIGSFWDDGFEADLANLSNVSFAHMPMSGRRFDNRWGATVDGSFPLMGNRGPKDGVDDPSSMTYGRNGQWGGHMVFADAHVEFTESFTPTRLNARVDGAAVPDNIFSMQEGAAGSDAILAFTKRMEKDGPVLQFD